MAEPRLPNVGEFVRGVGTLREIVVVPPPPQPPPTTVYVFEETTAQVRILLSGGIIETGSTFNDFYGRGMCIERALEQAREFVKRKKIGLGSDVEVVVVCTIYRTTREVDPLDRENFYDKTFVRFANQESKRYRDRTEHVEEVVWSSRRPKRLQGKDSRKCSQP